MELIPADYSRGCLDNVGPWCFSWSNMTRPGSVQSWVCTRTVSSVGNDS